MKFSAILLMRHFSQLYTGDTAPDGALLLAQVLGESKSWRRVDLALYPGLRMGGFSELHLHGPAGRHLSTEIEVRRGYSLHV